MEAWIYFVLAAQLIWAFTVVIDKIVLSKGYIKSPLVYVALNGLTNVLIVLLLPFADFEPLKLADFAIALFSSASLVVSIVLWYKAVSQEEVSRVIIMFQLIPVFVWLMAFLFLGESLKGYQLAGFLCLITAGFAVSYKKTNGKFRLSRAFYYVLASSFFVALAYISSKHVFNVTGFWSGVLWLRLTTFVALAVLLAPSVRKEFFDTFKNMKNKIKALLGAKMAIDFAAFALSDYAISVGAVSLISALSNATAPLFVFMLASLATIYLPSFIDEDIHKRNILTKLAALGLIIVGIWFMEFG